MLSQGRVKPNSASRTQQGSSSGAGQAQPSSVHVPSIASGAANYVAPQRLLAEAKNAAMLRSSAPEPFAPPPSVPPPGVHSAPSGGNVDGTALSHRASLPGGAALSGGASHTTPTNVGPARSSSSLAVAHQEFSASSGGFPARHSAGLHAATSPGPVSTSGSGATGRKGVAPQNARPVPVSHSAEPHAPVATATSGSFTNTASASSSSSGPVLSNTARYQQQLQLRQQQQQQQSSASLPASITTPPPLVQRGGSVSGSSAPQTSVPTANGGGRGSTGHQDGGGGNGKRHPIGSSSDDGARSSCNSSANSSENSPTTGPLSAPHAATNGAKLQRTSEDVHHTTRVLMNVAAEFAGGSKGNTPRGDGGNSGAERHSHHQPLGLFEEESGTGFTSEPEDAPAQHHASTARSQQAPLSSSQRSSNQQQQDDVTTQRASATGATSTSKRTSSTPTPPPSTTRKSSTSTSGAAKQATGGGGATGSSASSGGAAAAAKAPQIDIGPACQSLSLYDAFTFDAVLKMWVVRDDVLSKCLEYIRIMGYQHPGYARAVRTDAAAGNPPPALARTSSTVGTGAAAGGASSSSVIHEKMKTSSIWCSSSTIATPIVAANPLGGPLNKTPAASVPTSVSGTTSPAVASPTVPAAAKLNDDRSPPLNNGPQWKLVPLKTPSSTAPLKSVSQLDSSESATVPSDGTTPTTSAPPEPAGPPPGATSDEEPIQPLFFECEESLRWLAEQEYVIGTILLTCSFEPMSTTEKRAKLSMKKQQQQQGSGGGAADADSPPGKVPLGQLVRRQYVPSHTHPIRYVAAHVIHNFSHWGDFKSFSAVWDAQVRLVLGVAQPSHQKTIPVPETGLVFSSEFECGNLARVQRHVQGAYNNPFAQNGVCPPGTSTNVYLLWIEGDTQSDKRLWFRFAVSGCKAREPLCLRLMNIAPNARLYRNGMKPVWRAGASQLQWTPVDDYTFHCINDDRDGELSFYIIPKSSFETIHVAFCVPYSYGDLLCHITQWHAIVKRSACNIRFEERVLCRTLDERKLHLLIITSQTEKIGGKQQHQQLDSRGRPIQQAGATPYSVFASGKKVILISGRVHPGEVTASHAVHGIVSFLLSHDPRAATLREHFIFFVVPMLNPDGVARGYSRLDQNGLNLNRCYNDPNPLTQPTVHSLRNVFDHLQTNFRDRFFMYLDFHSHASQQSGFAFGNHLPNSVQHWNMLFPRLIGIHSNELFDFETCRFTRGHMVSKDGTSRVLFGGSLIHSYTVELTHFTDFKTFGDRHPTAPPSSTVTAPPGSASGSVDKSASVDKSGKPAVATPSSGKKDGDRKDSVAGKGDASSATTAASTPLLQSPVINSVLSQSAEVGRACVLALLDYCIIGDPSADLLKFGSMDRVIREVKREIRGGGPQRPSSYNSQSSFKQY